MIPSNKILSTLKSLKPNLSKTEQKIIKGILENPDEIIYIATGEIAKKFQVGEASIIRFCKKIGFNGFQHFKVELAKELSVRKINGLFDSDTSQEDLVMNFADQYRKKIEKALDETLELNSFIRMQKCVDALKKAEKVFIFGIGNSGITATDAKIKLLRLGLEVDAMDNSQLMMMKASLLSSNDVAIAISNSGNTETTVKTLKLAKKMGATTIAITNSLNSKIIQDSDFYLINAKGEEENKLGDYSLESKVSQLLIIEVLYGLLRKEKEIIEKNSENRIIEALNITE